MVLQHPHQRPARLPQRSIGVRHVDGHTHEHASDTCPTAYSRHDEAKVPLLLDERTKMPRRTGSSVSGDFVAVLLATLGGLSVAWTVIEVRGYVTSRRSHGPRAPGRNRMRASIFATLTVVGVVLGIAISALIGE